MIVHVTQKHIDEGLARQWHACPVALALRDAGIYCPEVLTRSVWVTSEREIPLPSDAERFIGIFDEHGAGVPFSFELDI
jgi:hypothetical protein